MLTIIELFTERTIHVHLHLHTLKMHAYRCTLTHRTRVNRYRRCCFALWGIRLAVIPELLLVIFPRGCTGSTSGWIPRPIRVAFATRVLWSLEAHHVHCLYIGIIWFIMQHYDKNILYQKLTCSQKHANHTM